MAAPIVDISLIGDKALIKALGKLPGAVQKKVVRQTMRKSLKRVYKAVVAAVPVDTGRLRAAMAAQRVRAGKRSRTSITFSVEMPERDLLGIDPGSPWFYAAHVEYGHGTVAPRSYIRATVNRIEKAEHNLMRLEITRGVEKEFEKMIAKR